MLDKYKYTDKEIKLILSSINILVDTREQVNNHLLEWFDSKKIKYISKKLDHGDYSFMIPKNESLNIDRDLYFNKDMVIERKGSLDELALNFSKERDRIKNEFAQYQGKMTLVIEGADYKDLCEGNYRSQYAPASFNGTLMSFSERYNVPFVFIKDKEYTARFIYFKFYYYLRNIINN